MPRSLCTSRSQTLFTGFHIGQYQFVARRAFKRAVGQYFSTIGMPQRVVAKFAYALEIGAVGVDDVHIFHSGEFAVFPIKMDLVGEYKHHPRAIGRPFGVLDKHVPIGYFIPAGMECQAIGEGCELFGFNLFLNPARIHRVHLSFWARRLRRNPHALV